jgi:hypothetical protein
MSPTAFFAERIAVIGREDDDAVVVEMFLLQKLHEAAKTRIEPPEARGRPWVETGRVRLARRNRPLRRNREMDVL